ncbi:translocase outer membrane 20-2 [Artemisia annua]|uniref:Translocase outer membrane 20-2 n=1 Tax=Artemisia annua TaxID=35608 RepID=A0A2U1NVB6_ARTAN|nr:translocase outer membrane 20-2 [Artemisia annua]
MDMMNVPELERIMLFEQARMAAEGEYLKNPTDVDNLTRWGGSLLELSQYGTMDESKKMLREAVSKLEEALSINPAKHEARWCLGNAYTANAFLNSNHDEAKILFDEAFQCFQRAVEESPESEHYLQSLAACAKAPDLHKEIHAQGGLGQAQQTLGGGPAASSSATGSAKKKSSDLTYDICGWVILAVGIITWIGMAKSQLPPPPAR